MKNNVKRQTFLQHSSVMEQSNLLLSVPPEIVQLYKKHLDLKSCIMLSCTCKATSCPEPINQREEEAVYKLIDGVVNLTREVHDVFCTPSGRSKLIARMLRKLIFVSVSDINSAVDSAANMEHCRQEYMALYAYVAEDMQINITAFNNMLEDAQFEFRGFSIIGMNPLKREQLDTFKKLVEDKYFDNPFLVHTYLSFGTMFVELNFDGSNVSFDIHQQHETGGYNWMFLQDTIIEWMEVCDSHHKNDKLYQEYLKSDITVSLNMVQWLVGSGEQQSQKVMTNLVRTLMPYKALYMGCTHTTLEVWNDTFENNWLLADVMHEVLQHEMYNDRLKMITFNVQDEFNCTSLL